MKDTTYKHKGYTGLFSRSEEDGTYSGKVIGIKEWIVFGGKTLKEAKLSFEDIVDQYLNMCAQEGTEPEIPSTQTTISVPTETYERACSKAQQKNIPVNELINAALRRA